MQKLKEYKYVILIVLVILGFIFYWFQWRPFLVRKNCAKEASSTFENLVKGHSIWDMYYSGCIKEKGLEK